MTHSSRFRERLFTELRFSTRHLGPLRQLYRRLCEDALEPGVAFEKVVGLHPNMAWHYAASPRTLAAFDDCLERSNLQRSFEIVGGRPRLHAACFIVTRKELPDLEFHIDYGDEEIPKGVTSTMLTPLLPFERGFGHLDYRADEKDLEYRYQLGRAILFDGKFEHRSQPFRCSTSAERVLVSWSIASTERRYAPAIRRVIESQTNH